MTVIEPTKRDGLKRTNHPPKELPEVVLIHQLEVPQLELLQVEELEPLLNRISKDHKLEADPALQTLVTPLETTSLEPHQSPLSNNNRLTAMFLL